MYFPRLRATWGNLGPYGDLLSGALQPSILALDPAMARGLFERDLGRLSSAGTQRRAADDQAAALDDALTTRERESGRHGFGFLQPGYRPPRPRSAGDGTTNHTGYMLAARQREAALQQYDGLAPYLRSQAIR